ncbi:hypothetical protein CFAM422_006381 [Trichoderma lentiforme]|uniref:Uncharacterized protein n=1 Tax=Trichoderma lentiforme TaxID=1567552 RepID=A0A9P4XGA6_9HYPO|nr:hypothetical protein CFAM422_006381 [Trichoderma lentiforme]
MCTYSSRFELGDAIYTQCDLAAHQITDSNRLSKTPSRASADSQTSNTPLSTFTYAKDESNNITKYLKRHFEKTYKEDVKTWTPAMVAEFKRNFAISDSTGTISHTVKEIEEYKIIPLTQRYNW